MQNFIIETNFIGFFEILGKNFIYFLFKHKVKHRLLLGKCALLKTSSKQLNTLKV